MVVYQIKYHTEIIKIIVSIYYILGYIHIHKHNNCTAVLN